MKRDEVDVIISQARHEELLEKERRLAKYIDNNSILLGFKYLETTHYLNILDRDRNVIEFINEHGKDVPQLFKEYVDNNIGEIQVNIERINMRRVDRIDAAVEQVRMEIQRKKDVGMKMPTIIRWFNSYFGKGEEDAR